VNVRCVAAAAFLLLDFAWGCAECDMNTKSTCVCVVSALARWATLRWVVVGHGYLEGQSDNPLDDDHVGTLAHRVWERGHKQKGGWSLLQVLLLLQPSILREEILAACHV
jgi:hypothetical protein